VSDVSTLESGLDVIALLDTWGFDTCDTYQVSSVEYRSACFIHQGDNTSSLSLRFHKGRWFVQCYSHGCFNGTLVDLGITRGKTFRDIMSDYEACQGESSTKRPVRKCTRSDGDVNVLPDNTMDKYEPSIHRNLIELGYERDILRDTFDVRYCSDPYESMFGRIVYGVRDRVGNMVSVQGRRTRACGEGASKYIFLGGTSAKHHVYGVWEWRHRIRRAPYIVVAESPKSVWRGWQVGIPTLATMGIRFTAEQVRILASLGRPLVLIADHDASNVGYDGMRELAYALRQYVPVRLGMVGDVGMDVSDYRTRDEWMAIISRAEVV
jgi:hypothetical protein